MDHNIQIKTLEDETRDVARGICEFIAIQDVSPMQAKILQVLAKRLYRAPAYAEDYAQRFSEVQRSVRASEQSNSDEPRPIL